MWCGVSIRGGFNYFLLKNSEQWTWTKGDDEEDDDEIKNDRYSRVRLIYLFFHFLALLIATWLLLLFGCVTN